MLWNATVGNHTLKIEIITAEPEFESDSTDNIATKVLTVIEKESDDGDKKDKKEDNTLFLLLISIIIIIVIILVLFLILRKKKGKPAQEELVEDEARIRIEEGTIDTTGETIPPAPEDYEQEFIQEQPYDEQQQVGQGRRCPQIKRTPQSEWMQGQRLGSRARPSSREYLDHVDQLEGLDEPNEKQGGADRNDLGQDDIPE